MQPGDEIRPHQSLEAMVAADQGQLRDNTLHPPVDRGHDKHVRAAVTRPPNADPPRVGWSSPCAKVIASEKSRTCGAGNLFDRSGEKAETSKTFPPGSR
jgi:hypothetical protein